MKARAVSASAALMDFARISASASFFFTASTASDAFFNEAFICAS